MAGLPFSGCESGRLREAPIGTKGLRACGTEQAGHRTFGSRTGPGGKRDFGQRNATGDEELRLGLAGQDRASARELRNPAGPRISVHGLSGGTEASAEDPAGRGTPASADDPPRREEGCKSRIRRAANRQGFGPDGEPAGKPEAASAANGPRRKRWPEPPVQAQRPRNRPARNASPPRPGSTRRDSGGRRQRRPPLSFGGPRFVIPAQAGISLSFQQPKKKWDASLRWHDGSRASRRRQSSRRRPALRQPA